MSLELLEKPYSQERFEAFLKEVFDFEAIDSRFKKEGLREQDLKHIDSYKYIGRTKRLADKSRLGFFVFKSKSKNIEKKRVGFNLFLSEISSIKLLKYTRIFFPTFLFISLSDSSKLDFFCLYNLSVTRLRSSLNQVNLPESIKAGF